MVVIDRESAVCSVLARVAIGRTADRTLALLRLEESFVVFPAASELGDLAFV